MFYETKDVRIYVLDQHGEVVKTSFGQSYANNTIQLSSMIQKLINSEPETPYIDKQFTITVNDGSENVITIKYAALNYVEQVITAYKIY